MSRQEEILTNLKLLEKCLYLEKEFKEDALKYDNLIMTEEYKYHILYSIDALFILITEFFQRMVDNEIYCISSELEREFFEKLNDIEKYWSILPEYQCSYAALNNSIFNYFIIVNKNTKGTFGPRGKVDESMRGKVDEDIKS